MSIAGSFFPDIPDLYKPRSLCKKVKDFTVKKPKCKKRPALSTRKNRAASFFYFIMGKSSGFPGRALFRPVKIEWRLFLLFFNETPGLGNSPGLVPPEQLVQVTFPLTADNFFNLQV